jgi:hypothetical protein
MQPRNATPLGGWITPKGARSSIGSPFFGALLSASQRKREQIFQVRWSVLTAARIRTKLAENDSQPSTSADSDSLSQSGDFERGFR